MSTLIPNDPIRTIKELVAADISDRDGLLVPPSDVHLVWFAYILGGWKGLAITLRPDADEYYEVTYDKANDRVYVDTYFKVSNCIYDFADKED